MYGPLSLATDVASQTCPKRGSLWAQMDVTPGWGVDDGPMPSNRSCYGPACVKGNATANSDCQCVFPSWLFFLVPSPLSSPLRFYPLSLPAPISRCAPILCPPFPPHRPRPRTPLTELPVQERAHRRRLQPVRRRRQLLQLDARVGRPARHRALARHADG